MTAHHIDIMASRVAVAMNGGDWGTHYTEGQKDLWRARVRTMLEARK